MKRIIAIFLLLTFLTANTGVAVTLHYCGGKLSTINFFSLDKHPCKCGKKAMKKDCCKDKTTFLKMKDDIAKSNLTSFKITQLNITMPLTKLIEFVPKVKTLTVSSLFYHPPPFKPKSPIYLLDRVLLI